MNAFFFRSLPGPIPCLAACLSTSLVLSASFVHAEEAEEGPPRADLVTAAIDAGQASEDGVTRAWALRAIGETARPAWARVAEGLENAQPVVRLAAAETLLRKNQRALAANAALVELYQAEDATIRRQILEVVAPQLGERQRLDLYRGLLAVSDDSAWGQVVQHLARRTEGAEHALLQAVATGADLERGRVAIQAMAAARRAEALPTLRALVASRTDAHREEALTLARALGSPEAREAVRPLLRPGDALAQRTGAWLARFGEVDALGVVAALARDTEAAESERVAALNLLNAEGQALFSWAELEGMLEESGRSPAFRRAVWEAVGASNAPEARARLQQGLDSTFADDRILALHGAGFTQDTALIPTLEQVVTARGAHGIRSAAVVALGRIGGDDAARILAQHMRFEREADVKLAFVEALGRTESTYAAQPIIFEFAQRNDDIARVGLVALERLANPEAARQIETVSETWRSSEIRWRAAIVLHRLDPTLGRIRILQLLDRPPSGFEDDLAELPSALRAEIDDTLLTHAQTQVREAALRRVRAREDGGWSALRAYAASAPTQDVRRAAIQVVTEQARMDDLETLQRLAGSSDRQTRLQAYRALGTLESEELEAWWHERLTDTDQVVRIVAAWALLRMGRAA